MKRIDMLMARLKALAKPVHILCRMPDGREMPMDILEAMRTGATFIRTLDGNHDFDELYRAVLSEEADFSDLLEVR